MEETGRHIITRRVSKGKLAVWPSSSLRGLFAGWTGTRKGVHRHLLQGVDLCGLGNHGSSQCSVGESSPGGVVPGGHSENLRFK